MAIESTDVNVVMRARRRTTLRRWTRTHPLLRVAGAGAFIEIIIALLAVAAASWVWPLKVPLISFVAIVVVAGMVLPVRRLLVVYALMAACVGVLLVDQRTSGVPLAIFLVALVSIMGMMWLLARSRSRLGTVGIHGDNMLVDLRDRIAAGGQIPPLSRGWRAQSSVRSAYGDAFSGDFLVSALSVDGHMLEVALVDVSGKGREAGTRGLLLSGAMGGLLGSVRPGEFLGSANSYLVRQRWPEGFATAVHAAIDLRTGDYSIGTAGHPSPCHYSVGSGTWRLVTGARGALLGVMEGVCFSRVNGRLEHGDALLLYSDGIIESRDHDLAEGVDRMLGVATQAMIHGGGGLAERVSRAARSGMSDDRAAFAVIRQ